MARRAVAGLRVLVTGASSGIGAALAQALVDGGARVAGTGREAAGLARVGPLELEVVADLLELGAPAAVVRQAVSALGGLDVVVSNAGQGWMSRFEDTPPEVIDRMLDVNLRAPMHLAQAAGPYLKDSPARGQLVLVGSIAGLVGVAGEVAYGTSKAGLKGLADSLRAEWSPLTVSLVSPGAVDTPFFDRRNRPYERSWPRPLKVAQVTSAIVSTIERRKNDVLVPGWLAVPARLNGAVPSLYHAVAHRAQGLGAGR